LGPASGPTGLDHCPRADQPPAGPYERGGPDPTLTHRRDGHYAVRLGLVEVQGLGRAVAERIVAERERAPFTSQNDVIRRAGLTVAQTEALATAGAFADFGLSRRQALWNAGYADTLDTLPGTAIDAAPPVLPQMSPVELTLADLWATKISPSDHPVGHLRPVLDEQGVVPIRRLGPDHAERRVLVAGVVTHRQRPGTAGGVTFLNLEDETGMLNVVCSVPLWQRHRRVARSASGMLIRGKIEHSDGVTNLVADRLEPLSAVFPQARGVLPGRPASRDFR
ncbi:MAG: OB-fold nucleic acid binding domain-containing protein, partial [Actinomycetes bacterium]